MTTVIPTIGRETLWTRTLPSVFAQPDARCIIVGDGVDIPPVDDARVTVLRIERPEYPADQRERWRVQGVAAFAYGLDHVETEWWSYLADDDAYRPNHHALLTGYDADVVFGRHLLIQPGGMEHPVRRDVPVPPGTHDVAQGAYITRLRHYPAPELLRPGGWDATWWATLPPTTTYVKVDEVVLDYYPDADGYGYGAR